MSGALVADRGGQALGDFGPEDGRRLRLLEPPRSARRARYGLALITLVLLALVPGLAAAFAGPLTAHASPPADRRRTSPPVRPAMA